MDRKKDLVALSDGYREAEEPWAEVLRDLKKRGMRASVAGIDDGASGFWAARTEAFLKISHQRDRVHKTANVLDALPKSTRRQAKKSIKEIPRPTTELKLGRETLTTLARPSYNCHLLPFREGVPVRSLKRNLFLALAPTIYLIAVAQERVTQ